MSLQNEINSYWTSFSNDYIQNLLGAYQQLEIDDNNFAVTEEYYNDLEDFFKQSYIWDVTKEHVEQIIEVANILPTKILMYYMQNLVEKNCDMFNEFYTVINTEIHEEFQYLLKRCICFEKCQIITKVINDDHVLLLEKVLKKVMGESL